MSEVDARVPQDSPSDNMRKLLMDMRTFILSREPVFDADDKRSARALADRASALLWPHKRDIPGPNCNEVGP